MKCCNFSDKSVPQDCVSCKHAIKCRAYAAHRKWEKGLCGILDCDEKNYSRGLCKSHYQFVTRKQNKKGLPLEERVKWQWENLENLFYSRPPTEKVESKFSDINIKREFQ